MPMVKRKVVHENTATSMSKITHIHELYVPRKQMRKTDVEIPLDEISDRMLAELAGEYPDEFGAEAELRGVGGGAGYSGRLSQLLSLSTAKELVAEVEKLDTTADSEILWQIFEVEIARETPRSTVLAALRAHGVTDDDSEGEGEDEGDEDSE